MYNEVKCICITCDNCDETFLDEHSGFSIYSDKDAAHDAADQDEWHSEGGTHYCPKCHSYDDNDELVINESLKKESGNYKMDQLIKLADDEIIKDWESIIKNLKNNFSGSNDYLSGVNDGMYSIIKYKPL